MLMVRQDDLATPDGPNRLRTPTLLILTRPPYDHDDVQTLCFRVVDTCDMRPNS